MISAYKNEYTCVNTNVNKSLFYLAAPIGDSSNVQNTSYIYLPNSDSIIPLTTSNDLDGHSSCNGAMVFCHMGGNALPIFAAAICPDFT